MKKVALITGAAGGIGKEFVKIHTSRGGDVVAVDLNTEGLLQLKKELGGGENNTRIYTIAKNLTHPDATREIYEEVKAQGIQVEYLINNAGFGGVGKFHERAWEKDLAMIQVNILALTSLTRFFLPDFIEKNTGKILNVSSTVSLLPGPMQAVYFASKAFVTSFTNSISGELMGTGVSATALLPGATQTGFGANSGMDKTSIYKKPASASDVAKDGYEAMIKGELEVISGLPWSQKMQLSITPLLPKKMVVERVRKQQEIN
ncbi:SDR family oxidoreductase [Flammeovirga sp. EKP202]|uniref:SDR family NAD(P)-dependent oxidoreductase n=1 Tax=Flammeovirga sp. EKP202 TaxID=2770592 RepID=UPI00165F976B|nr:SDR family NAD(P)-dependent oxidoreductase [Flammeovirga sp. EKP202]MBD0404054.1 SDR family NAD(P)-dependent oxidoreductase [Flammeovirga sp. EKP202]